MSAPAIDLNDGLHCPVCEQPFAMDDLCSTDIEMGVCHAACLEGAAVVDLETGEPKDGKIDTYRFASLFSEAEIDEMALDAFAAAMRDKLARKRDEGRGGWHDKTDCTNEYLSDLLRRHVEKGDPVDVANIAMMIYQRGEQISASVIGAGRPFMYGIRCPDGSAYMDEVCVDIDRNALDELIAEYGMDGHEVVALYTGHSVPVAAPSRRPADEVEGGAA